MYPSICSHSLCFSKFFNNACKNFWGKMIGVLNLWKLPSWFYITAVPPYFLLHCNFLTQRNNSPKEAESDYHKTVAEAFWFNLILNQSLVHYQSLLWLYRDVVTDLNTWVHSAYFCNFEWVYSGSYSAILKSMGARARMEPTLPTPL